MEFSVASFTNFRHTSTLIRRNFLRFDYASTAYYEDKIIVTTIGKSRQNTDICTNEVNATL